MSLMGAASMYKDGVMTALRDIYAWETPPGAQFSTIFANSTQGEVLGGIAPKANKLEQAKHLLLELAVESKVISSAAIIELVYG